MSESGYTQVCGNAMEFYLIRVMENILNLEVMQKSWINYSK